MLPGLHLRRGSHRAARELARAGASSPSQCLACGLCPEARDTPGSGRWRLCQPLVFYMGMGGSEAALQKQEPSKGSGRKWSQRSPSWCRRRISSAGSGVWEGPGQDTQMEGTHPRGILGFPGGVGPQEDLAGAWLRLRAGSSHVWLQCAVASPSLGGRVTVRGCRRRPQQRGGGEKGRV